MQSHIVLTAIGPDRPGLVNALSDTIADGGGNWLEARMASLAGQFAGIVLVAVDADRADALAAALQQLQARGLRVTVEHSRSGPEATSTGTGRRLRLDLVGHDRPGIVRDISRVLATHRVSIVEFESERASGSFSGEALFKAKAQLELPQDLDLDQLRSGLEALANELMVDLDLAALPSS